MRHQRLRDCSSAVVNCLSWEFILTKWKWANGGDVILMRTVAVSLELYITAIGFKNLVDPHREWSTSFSAVGSELAASWTYIGPIFAAVYAALYSRFSSQWSYLAGVYNRIKETEARGVGSDGKAALAQWKAGFIDDADVLHLANKASFAGAVLKWAKNREVSAAYVAVNPSTGAADLRALVERIESQYTRHVLIDRESPIETMQEGVSDIGHEQRARPDRAT